MKLAKNIGQEYKETQLEEQAELSGVEREEDAVFNSQLCRNN